MIRIQHVGESHSLLRAECRSQSARRGNITTPRRVVSRRLPLAERGNFTCLPPFSELLLNQRPGAGLRRWQSPVGVNLRLFRSERALRCLIGLTCSTLDRCRLLT